MTLLYKNEKPLFLISLFISIILWLLLIVGTMGTALIYILFFFIFYLFSQSALISYLKGTAVKIDAQQYPDIYEQVNSSCEKLGMKVAPDTYMLHADGAFNAFAARFLRKNYVVLFSDVVDAFEKHKPSIKFYIGHELGHINRNHLLWGPILFPASILPIIGAAYSRAREYTCDNYGIACCDNPKDAAYGLSALAAGGKRWPKMSIKSYVSQASATGGFWMSLHELISDYPWLVKRMSRIVSQVHNKPSELPKRHPFAWLIASFIPRIGGPASGATILVTIAIIGILAAVAIPQFAAYRAKAVKVTMDNQLRNIEIQAASYKLENGRWPCSTEEMGYVTGPEFAKNGWSLQVNCEYALAIIVFDKNGQQYYRALNFETEGIEEGPM